MGIGCFNLLSTVKQTLLFVYLFLSVWVFAQTGNYEHVKFCTNLNRVFESGRVENFESLIGLDAKQSPFLPAPGPRIKLQNFPVLYVDKDSRFVGKTNQNFDSLSAITRANELKAYITPCLDSTQWFWVDFTGDDSSTVFFREDYEWQAISKELTLTVATVRVTEKVYSVNMYIKRNRK